MAQEMRVARPYAKALFLQAQHTQTLEAWERVLKRLTEVCSDPVGQVYLKDPTVSELDKEALFVAAVAEEGIDPRALLQTLFEFKRILLLPFIYEQYVAYKREATHETIVEARVAVPLSEELFKQIQARLELKLKKRVHLKVVEDPSLLGGLVLATDDWLYDGSVKTKISKMAQAMMSTLE